MCLVSKNRTQKQYIKDPIPCTQPSYFFLSFSPPSLVCLDRGSSPPSLDLAFGLVFYKKQTQSSNFDTPELPSLSFSPPSLVCLDRESSPPSLDFAFGLVFYKRQAQSSDFITHQCFKFDYVFQSSFSISFQCTILPFGHYPISTSPATSGTSLMNHLDSIVQFHFTRIAVTDIGGQPCLKRMTL